MNVAVKNKSSHSKLRAISLPTVSWKFFYGSLILLSSLLLVFYVFSINELTRGVYLIKQYNKEINILVSENKILSNKFTNNNFLIKTQERAHQLSFEKTKDIKYVQVLESSLVRR